VVLEPTPRAPGGLNTLGCLSEATIVAECRFVVDPDPSGIEELYRRLDRDDDRVWAADLDRVVCPYLPICDPLVDQRVVTIDGAHLTEDFARAISPTVERYLTSNGVLPE